MMPHEIEAARQNPPREWVKLRQKDSDSFSEGDFAKAFCNFIAQFYWRPVDDSKGELHIIFRSNGSNDRYKYPDIPKSIYDEMWERAYFPQDYNRNFGSWITGAVTQKYEAEKYEG